MEMIRPSSVGPVALPQPRVPVTVRTATLADLPFIDALQKRHTKQVGWMPTKQIEGKIAAGHVLIAEEMQNDECRMQNKAEDVCISPSSFSIHHSAFCISSPAPAPLGYVIAADRYMKREDVGIVYQMNVEPGSRRRLVGATLLRAVFERAAYGCRLFCCWCAQDLEANRFWESLGFVPLAFRSGSAKKSRTHIFWQRRIRAGDTATPWWFPSQTSSGSIREDRLVLPIPPGTHWSDAKPVLLPQELSGVSGQLPAGARVQKPRASRAIGNVQPATSCFIAGGGLRFAAPVSPKPEAVEPKREPKRKTPRVKPKNDPRLVAAARELRDRWLERANEEGFVLPAGKYDVSRRIGENGSVRQPRPKQIPARRAMLLPAA